MPGADRLTDKINVLKGFSRCFQDVSVLDFSRYLPGPFCARILADLGCRVTKVELPHWPDPVRSQKALFKLLNSGKKILSLDFRKGEGRRRLLKLLERTDILLEGTRPGLMKRLELDFESLKDRFPRLIYCSITGYGQKGPRSRWAGHDLNYQALSGLLSLGGPENAPAMPPVQIGDISGSLYAALGILASLWERQRTGCGKYVDISMTATAFSLLPIPLSELISGKRVGPGQNWWNGRNPFYHIYRTKDGRFLTLGALEKGPQAFLLEQLKLKKLAPLLDDLETNGPDLKRKLSLVFLGKDLEHWTQMLQDKEVCLTPVSTIDEALQGI